jgi:hypothetical protein
MKKVKLILTCAGYYVILFKPKGREAYPQLSLGGMNTWLLHGDY